MSLLLHMPVQQKPPSLGNTTKGAKPKVLYNPSSLMLKLTCLWLMHSLWPLPSSSFFIKQKGLATGQITPLWFEAAIWKFSQEPEVTPRPTIAAEILKPVNLMRKILNEEVASSPPGSGELTIQFLLGKLDHMKRVDSSAIIELQVAKALAAGPGEAKLHEELLMMLPFERRHVGINTAVISVKSLLNSNLSEFCSAQVQQKMEEVLLGLRAIQRCHPPCFTAWGGDTLLKKVKD